MNCSSFARSLAVPLLALTGLTACANFQESIDGFFNAKPTTGPGQVDELLDRIERVHVDAELAGKSVTETIGLLQVMTAGDFKGDPAEKYARFLEALEVSERRADELHDSIQPMRKAADPFFSQWSASLGDFTNPDMRRHSQSRLLETRERYQAIVTSVEPAQATFEAYNRSLRDHALFLGHAFNPASVDSIRGELRTLAKMAVDVGQQLETTRQAARAYVEAASLPVQVEVADR